MESVPSISNKVVQQTRIAYLSHQAKIEENFNKATKHLPEPSLQHLVDTALYEAFAVGYDINQQNINRMIHFIEELMPALEKEPSLQMAYGLAQEFLYQFSKLKAEN